MTEQEKAILGEFYNPNYNKEIIEDRTKMQDLCFEYNNIITSNIEKRKELIKNIIGKYGENFLLEQPIYFDYGKNITIGERFYSNHNLTILDGAKVTFGNDCFIGPSCSFYTAIHPIDYRLRNKGLEKALPITVGDNVWFGGGVIVLPGITIGSNVVIGVGSVVTKDIPDNVIAVGNPCHIIKKIEMGELNEK